MQLGKVVLFLTRFVQFLMVGWILDISSQYTYEISTSLALNHASLYIDYASHDICTGILLLTVQHVSLDLDFRQQFGFF